MTTTPLCTNCAHSLKNNNILLCSHDANPVSGEPRHYCNTQRLVGAKDEAKAEEAATIIGFCGPSGRFFKALPERRGGRFFSGLHAAPPAPPTPPKPTTMAVPNS